MTNRKRTTCVIHTSLIFLGSAAILFGIWTHSAHATETRVQPAETEETKTRSESATASGKFVQQFYDWYNARPEKTLEIALEKRPQAFAPHLASMLKADIEASSKAPDEIVGLDFDPITSTNAENATKYVIGKVVTKGKTIWVDVYGFYKGKKSEKPIVTPEVEFRDKNWRFVNFHYGKSEFPENENLLSVLKALADSRKAGPSPAAPPKKD